MAASTEKEMKEWMEAFEVGHTLKNITNNFM